MRLSSFRKEKLDGEAKLGAERFEEVRLAKEIILFYV